MPPEPVRKIYEFLVTQDFLKSIAGDYAVELVKICTTKKKSVTDEELSRKLNLKVTEVRTILNRLHYRGIACYQKTKNVKTGWYSYTWEVKNSRIAEILVETETEKALKLEKSLEFEDSHEFFSSGKDSHEYPFEIAAEYGFKDPESGKQLELVDNKKRIKDLKKKVGELKAEVTELQKLI